MKPIIKIGYDQYELTVDQATAIMEIMSKGKPVKDWYSYGRVRVYYYSPKDSINVSLEFTSEIITHEEYEQLKADEDKAA